ncbi:MAG: translation elongation factor Ts [bacterium]|nr:translation elongation factor Ts [bacterium]
MSDAKQVMDLRKMTGAGVMDAKKALTEANGDIEKAVSLLKERGAIKASKREGRETSEGVVVSYIHHTKKLGSLVEIQCETDFVARNEEFQTLANDIAMQVAAIDPLYLSPDQIPTNEFEKQREIFKAEMKDENKPDEMKEKIIEGKLQKWYKDVCLLQQPFFKDEDMSIEQMIQQFIAKTGENVTVARFTRYSM